MATGYQFSGDEASTPLKTDAMLQVASWLNDYNRTSDRSTISMYFIDHINALRRLMSS
jgi:hypothetical protein